jgi:hypothetical protein
MARVFTTKFNFNHKIYDAIITILNTDGRPNFNIRLLDVELHELIPNGHLKYEGKDGFKDLAATENQVTQSLMSCLAASIENHLITTP